MASVDEEHTCGKGIAHNAVLPDALAACLRAIAEVQQNHIRSLDAAEPAGKGEVKAYSHLVAEGRQIADRLEALAGQMRGYRGLPMATHDMDKLTDAASVEAFSAMVAREKELLSLMQDRVAEWDGMLEAMSKA